MLYNRPSMHYDWNKNGMSDFICCIANHFLIRNNELISIVMFRSQDIWFGFFNDFYFKCIVYERLYSDLKLVYPNLKPGNIIWVADSFHLYERHFDKLCEIVENYKK